MRSPDELTVAFRANGSKVTPQRQLLFRLMHANASHPTAESLFAVASEQMPGISLRTVYQTLNDLTAMGELAMFDIGTGAARFDPNTDHHHHAVCDRCGLVRDVYVDRLDRLTLLGVDGFTITDTSIVFAGRCATCDTSRPPAMPPDQGSLNHD